MFQIGDKVVHPMHGAGIVDSIIRKKVDGAVHDYYQLKMPFGEMMVLVPIEHCSEIGVRAISTPEQMEEVLNSFPTLKAEINPNWNHRYRENLMRLKSGDMHEVAWVVKSLSDRDQSRGLSTGERKMLYSARQIMVSEMVLATGCTYEAAESKISMALAAR